MVNKVCLNKPLSSISTCTGVQSDYDKDRIRHSPLMTVITEKLLVIETCLTCINRSTILKFHGHYWDWCRVSQADFQYKALTNWPLKISCGAQNVDAAVRIRTGEGYDYWIASPSP